MEVRDNLKSVSEISEDGQHGPSVVFPCDMSEESQVFTDVTQDFYQETTFLFSTASQIKQL